MNNKLNILFLASWYPSRLHPTNGNFVQRHAKAIALYANVSVIFVSSDPNLDHDTFEIEEGIEDKVNTIRVFYKKVKSNIPIISDLIKLKRLLNAYFLGYKKIKEASSKPDLVHVHIINHAGIFALILNKLYKLPYVITEHSTIYHESKTDFPKIITKWVAKNALVVIPVSEDLKNAMLKHGLQNNYCIIPNVVDVNLFTPSSNNTVKDKKQILHISTLKDEHKNVKGLLNVMNQLSIKRDDFHLTIIGDVLEIGNFKKMVEKMNINNEFLTIKSIQPIEEIANSMKSTDFFVLFSNYENLPCVLIEALSCGIPVISTNVGGISEHISKDKGILIEPRNEEQLYASIEHMLGNHQEYDKNELRNYAVEHFSYENVGARFNELYNSVMLH